MGDLDQAALLRLVGIDVGPADAGPIGPFKPRAFYHLRPTVDRGQSRLTSSGNQGDQLEPMALPPIGSTRRIGAWFQKLSKMHAMWQSRRNDRAQAIKSGLSVRRF
jgi:hypothetical protein